MTSLHPAPPRHRRPVRPLRIAMLGDSDATADRGARSTAAVEIGRRLVRHGHDVTVYGSAAPSDGHGLRQVRLPQAGGTALAALHLLARRRHDVAVVFGTAHAPLVPLIRSRGTAVAVHIDALEWARNRSDDPGRRWARAAERLAIREADVLVADAHGIEDHLDDRFGLPTDVITYGAPVVHHVPTDLLEPLGLIPGHFHLAVARFAPEHHIDAIVEGYHRSDAHHPLVVVGDVPATGPIPASVRHLAAIDGRIRLLGATRDERLLDQLHAHAAAHVHGHSIGAADPVLLRAMGAGTAILAWDVAANREVVGTGGSFFSSPAQAARQIEEVERYPFRFRDLGELMQERARLRFDWDVVTEQYEALAARLSRGWSTHRMSTGGRVDPAAVLVPTRAEAHRG